MKGQSALSKVAWMVPFDFGLTIGATKCKPPKPNRLYVGKEVYSTLWDN
jgi:hypothetical protein